MQKFVKELSLAVLLVSCMISFQQCGDDALNPEQDFVSGTITFKNTNLLTTGGYYGVSVYSDAANPFSQNPLAIDSVDISISGNTATAYYKISGLASADYYIGAVWIRSSDNCVRGVLGTYGCDTLYNCTSSIKVTVPTAAGTGNLNFSCWTDTLRRLYSPPSCP